VQAKICPEFGEVLEKGQRVIGSLKGKCMLDEEKEYYSLIKRIFALWAPFYDAFVMPISGLRDKVVDFTNPGDGSKILDVATGTGKQAFAFAKMGYEVIGIDLSEAMLKVANKKNKNENVKFEVGDATNLPFEDNSFDVSCVSFGLHDMPLTIREKALKEMVRVTKTKGVILIVDYALPKSKISRFLIYHFINLYEGKYYSNFIKSDLEALLRKTRIEIKEELPVLLGAGKILKGIKMEKDVRQFNG
jgi:ubiquinone/menaquinone biosynthesis C-methylase UbiE